STRRSTDMASHTFTGTAVSLSAGQYDEDEDGNLVPHPEYADRHSLEVMLAPGDELPPIGINTRITVTIHEEER
ncbi:hypothetical protein, partial [Bacillus subtilis]|uniref:hypothetical protein n=1 Tax=Bacillus subtilis TaxID=1423 RepID=UPI00397F2CA7